VSWGFLLFGGPTPDAIGRSVEAVSGGQRDGEGRRSGWAHPSCYGDSDPSTAGESVPFVVDTIEVPEGSVEPYLAVVEYLGVPVMTDAGAAFVSCATTPAGLGESVDIQIVWAFDDHDQWNVIRKNMVLDPRWYQYADQVAALRTGGTRRFYYPVSFSSP
jgi:hypothetical protein